MQSAHPCLTLRCVRETCVRRLHAAWGVTICTSILPFARGCRVGVWYGFVGAALLPAVGTCVVLAFGAMPGRCCFPRVTLNHCIMTATDMSIESSFLRSALLRSYHHQPSAGDIVAAIGGVCTVLQKVRCVDHKGNHCDNKLCTGERSSQRCTMPRV